MLGAIDGFGIITRSERLFAKILDEQAAQEFFRELGLLEEMTRIEWAKGRLNEFVESWIESGEVLPDCIEFASTRYLTVKKK